ncbi:bifunctional DNA primase/polymerase [Streptomyces alkaliterrae]|uniref:DNA primase n=1 Tax=Streptomyces alkaliterrae TaxID=2213162 RepID=A0A5P0YUZ3_9ACTN|nr:bifunctional DNA primase/polymerase [Streptomyces alkaliterrae]MBB1253219.1 bifunctional DNA primase/polymerase [Streptomyces alkaliterrae]MBB1261684.1 bifunctional DNA primase/polymerase [Streptomyces alkaliterrae]MQS04116.1 DNA primase [Streptomyces alkaliterrae]
MGAREATSEGTTAPQIPAQRDGVGMLEHAVRYAKERAWDVFPGTWLETVDGVPRCTCGVARCDAPGAHPRDSSWPGQATGSATAARRMWEQQPTASVLLPTGRTFDAVDVPEIAGCLALARMERMGLGMGPVACTPYGRMLFFVLPGAAAKVPDLIRNQGWSPGAIDLTTHGEGGWVAAPPTRVGARGSVQWVRQPNAVNRWLPDAEEIIPQLAYACGREAAAARGH